MSDTPRTDFQAGWAVSEGGVVKAEYLYADTKGVFVLAAFARELERELAEAKAENATLLAQIKLDEKAKEMMLREWHKVKAENAQLREALKWAEPYVPKRADCETRRMIEALLPNA